jgi:hypothetical protein
MTYAARRLVFFRSARPCSSSRQELELRTPIRRARTRRPARRRSIDAERAASRRRRQAHAARDAARHHRIVIGSLALIAASGILWFAADFDTFLHSRFFWIKMGLVALLIVNGALLWRAESRAIQGDLAAWRMLRFTAMASIALWLLTTLGGVALPNIG